MRNSIILVAAALAALPVAAQANVLESAAPVTTEPAPASCESTAATISQDFDTGAFASCRFRSSKHLVVEIKPEDQPPINCSAWYAFRIDPRRAEVLTVDLQYDVCGHRYWPKISTDGKTWHRFPERAVRIQTIDGLKQATLTVPVSDQPLYIAGQEIFGPADYDEWLNGLSASPAATIWPFGTSAEGRAIPAMTIVAPGATPQEQIVLIGRQHPPEVTGQFALQGFVSAILAATPLAESFRQRFEVTLVPMLNPDGVVHGYWRHSTGHMDLNRDWGPFTQPETRLMDNMLREMAADPDKKLRLFVDFHSTGQDVFYTIPDDQPTDPELYTRDWLGRLQELMPDYAVDRDSAHNPDLPTSKSYVFNTYGVPTATFEIGDDTNRALIDRLGREAAIAMMETMLAR